MDILRRFGLHRAQVENKKTNLMLRFRKITLFQVINSELSKKSGLEWKSNFSRIG
jgi:hypothetical protein